MASMDALAGNDFYDSHPGMHFANVPLTIFRVGGIRDLTPA